MWLCPLCILSYCGCSVLPCVGALSVDYHTVAVLYCHVAVPSLYIIILWLFCTAMCRCPLCIISYCSCSELPCVSALSVYYHTVALLNCHVALPSQYIIILWLFCTAKWRCFLCRLSNCGCSVLPCVGALSVDYHTVAVLYCHVAVPTLYIIILWLFCTAMCRCPICRLSYCGCSILPYGGVRSGRTWYISGCSGHRRWRSGFGPGMVSWMKRR